MKLRVGSVSSGIGGDGVAWHPLGWESVFFSEIAPFPSAVLAHRFPDVPNLGDFTAADFCERARTCGKIDILAGGTPCQSFSIAGKRGSLEDDRGNLTLRFVEVVHELDPTIVVWENVPGVLSTRDNAFGCFLAGMVGESESLESGLERGRWPNAGVVVGPVRTLAWRVLDAQYFGLAQRRRRVCVVSFRTRDGINPGAVLLEPESLRRDSPPSREAGAGVARSVTASTEGCSEKEQQHSFMREDGEPLNPLGIPAISPAINARDSKGPSSDGPPLIPVAPTLRVRRLTPRECERLQGFPDGWTRIPWRKKSPASCPDGPRYKSLGNAWATNVFRWIGWRIEKVLKTEAMEEFPDHATTKDTKSGKAKKRETA